MDLQGVQSWTDRYVHAWRTNDPAAIGDLFTDDALYYTLPWREPWRGRDEILRGWSGDPDAPGTWECEYHAIAATGDTGVVRGWTRYTNGNEYANVFVTTSAAGGRASEFTEFFIKKPEPASAGR